MKNHIEHCKAEIARLQSWRGWFNLNRKLELLHYQNVLAVLLQAERQYNLKQRLGDPVLLRKGTGYGKGRVRAGAAAS